MSPSSSNTSWSPVGETSSDSHVPWSVENASSRVCASAGVGHRKATVATVRKKAKL